jgi:predicted outer membrane protein
MRMGMFGAALGATLVAGGGASSAPATTVLQDNMFLGSALAHTQSEIELAQLATTKAHTAQVVAYARRIVAERTPLRDQLAAAAQVSGVSGDTNHTPSIDTFKPLTDEAFERAYVASQLEDQQNNLDFFTFEASVGGTADLRQLAATALPQLQKDYADAVAVVKFIPFEAVQEDRPIGGVPAFMRRR